MAIQTINLQSRCVSQIQQKQNIFEVQKFSVDVMEYDSKKHLVVVDDQSKLSMFCLSFSWWGQAIDSNGVKGQRNISKKKYLKGIKKVTDTFNQNQIR